ncbi:MAG: hypothetical protein H6511_07860 [Holophagales bacterium]|nr:hypothetical protein [Holophagales bacterium]
MKPRTFVGLVLLVAAGVALACWTWVEAERQRLDIETALQTEAALLAESLAPGLASASDALREIDDAVAERLLDDARILAELARASDPDAEVLERIAEANGLDTIALLDRAGRVRRRVGDPLDGGIVETLAPLLAGETQEALLSPEIDDDSDHRAAAVALPRGGAVVVHLHATSAYAFARTLGLDNLLARLVRAESVLYLAYREEPGPKEVVATWDGGPVPPPSAATDAGRLAPLRDRVAFEVEVPVETPAGHRASLRVGLDGAAIERASVAGLRRTALVGVVLVGLGLASAAYALLRRERDRERQAAAERLADAEEARRRSERLALAGALTAGLAHEVRSPLNAIALAAQRLERSRPPEPALGFARLVRDEVRRLEGVLREFLELARPVSDRRQPVALADVAGEVRALLGSEAAESGVTLAPPEGDARAEVDRDAVRRALINLVRNAIQASPAGTTVRVAIDGSVGGAARVRILDQGSGVAEEMAERLLEPFVTTRADGTGLGLALVRRVAEEHGGAFHLVGRAEGGAEAVLTLPGAPPPPTETRR